MASSEKQVLDFIISASKKSFDKEMKALHTDLSNMEQEVDSIFHKATLGGARSFVGSLQTASHWAGKLVEPFAEHVMNMEQYRKEAGLTQDEIADYSQEVISASTRYGVALSRVANMSKFAAKGLGDGRLEAVALSASMADLADFTGIADETIAEMATNTFRLFNIEGEKTQNLMYGLAEVARQSHVPFEDIALALNQNADALRAMPFEQSVRDMGVFISSMIQSGAQAQHYNEVLRQLGDTNSTLRLRFDAIVQSGGGMQELMGDLGFQVDHLRSQVADGTISHQAYERSLQNLAQNFGVSQFTLEKMADSWDNMSGSIEAFDDIQNKSVEENRASFEERASALTRFTKRWEQSQNKIMGVMENLWGPNSAIWGWLGNLLDTFDEAIAKFNVLDPFASDQLSDANIGTFRAGSEQERYIQEKSIINRQANLFRARGMDVEAKRFRTEQLAKLDDRYKDVVETVPSTSVPEPDGGDNNALTSVMKEVAENTRSMKRSNEEMAREARLNSIVGGTATGRGNNRATSATEGIR